MDKEMDLVASFMLMDADMKVILIQIEKMVMDLF